MTGPTNASNAEDLVVVRVRRNRHGDPVVASEHTLPGCVVAPTSSTEDVSRGDQVVGRLNVYVLHDADVTAADRIRRPSDPTPGANAGLKARGPWQVVGDPAPWRSPFGGWAPGQVVQIERVSG